MSESSPLLAIKCLAYNHEPYIRQCLDGFIMQKTDFPFIAIVHDDASTDKTADIIREYAEKYPDIIKPIFEKENQYSKHDGTIRRKMNAAIPESVKYIAMCEGDDYWIDSYKLQKQVDCLKANPDCSFCTTAAQLVDSKLKKIGVATMSSRISYFGMKDAIQGYGHKASTPSFVFKSELYRNPLPNFMIIAPCGDYTLPILGCLYGRIVNIPDETCVHRVLSKGSMTESWIKDFAKREKYNIKFEKMLDEIDVYTQKQYHDYIEIERFGLWFRSYLASRQFHKIRNVKTIKYVMSQGGVNKYKLLAKIYIPHIYNLLQRYKHSR